MNLTPKVAIYIRVSTQYQTDKDSLQVQRRELIAYADLVLQIRDYEVFEDPGYSAKNTDRPAYQKMMSRLRTGEFSHLLVWKIDRISRNLLDFSAMYTELKNLGITFVSKNEQFDTSSPIGEAMLKIILVFAELERNMTAERVSAVMISRANNKQWNGGRVPYGYRWDKNAETMVIDEKESKILLQMFSLYEEYQSITSVVRYLNERSIFTRSGKPWSATGIGRILTSDWYIGSYVYNKTEGGVRTKKKEPSEWIVIENHHPALIEPTRLERIKHMLYQNRRRGFKKGDTVKIKHIHLFSGILTCASCGANMSASSARRLANGWRPSNYGCSNRRRRSAVCLNKYTSDTTIAPFVLILVSRILQYKDQVVAGTITPSDFQSILTAPKIMESIERIDHLDTYFDSIASGSSGIEFTPPPSDSHSHHDDEYESLLKSRQKNENALRRLQSLYLYGDNMMPEKDYIIERKRILDDLEDIEQRLNDIGGTSLVSDKEFRDKASYFIMVEKLLVLEPEDAAHLIRTIEPEVLQTFFRRIFREISVFNGRVAGITFKNGLNLQFTYKREK